MIAAIIFFAAISQLSTLQVQAGNEPSIYKVYASQESISVTDAEGNYHCESKNADLYYIQKSPWVDDWLSQKHLNRPTVAVALGGGGARALVNVGILKALEEENIPIDLVLGSSMGAIVAVLYGSGMPLAHIEELVTSDILPSMFDLNFPFVHSIIDTRRVNFFIQSVSPAKRLEDFPIPTALLSYDLTNGVKYVHTAGPISQEIQGSYAIPLFFPVVRQGEFFLMDPGILELTPARTAKALGAEVVISTTAFDELPYNTYDLPIRAWTRFINLMKESNSREIIEEDSDVTINCMVGDYSFMDYHLAAEFIDLGYREAQKLIPELKQVLAKKEIPLHTGERGQDQTNIYAETQGQIQTLALTQAYTSTALKSVPRDIQSEEADVSDLSRVVSDVQAERLIYDFTRIKPLVYIGREHSVFKQTLLPEEISTTQYGAYFQHKNWELKALTRGNDLDYFETQVRFIRLTPALDLIARAYQGERGNDRRQGYALDLKFYHPTFTAAVGWMETDDLKYLHTGGTVDLKRGKGSLRVEGDIYTPCASGQQGKTELKYVYGQTIDLALGERLTLQPKLIASNTRKEEIFAHHLLYRGVEQESGSDPELVQVSLELDYTYSFPYSIEIFQCMQVKEVTWYQFADAYYNESSNAEPAYAVGSGVACELNLLGIKPFSFGGYFAYDLKEETWRSTLCFDLVF